MRLDQFDLNLLIALDALIAERNVTTAAKRLNLTQSAMSSALKRLRDSLGDELLVQHGKRMIPTARALQLAPEVASVLQSLRGLIASRPGFEPGSSTRQFRIAASDYISAVLVGPLIQRLRPIAPGIRFELSLPTKESHRALDDGDLDLILQPDVFAPREHPSETLWHERYVVIGCRDNPLLRTPLSAEQFYTASHASVEIANTKTFIDAAADKLAEPRRVELVVPSYLALPCILPGTRLLALAQARLARLMEANWPLAFTECPIDLPVMNEVMQFHSARTADLGLAWLRDQLKLQAELVDQRA